MFVVKVPGINGEGSGGCERSGNAIINELRKISVNESGKVVDVNLLDLEEIHLDNSDLEITSKLIHKNSLEMFETKPRTIFLGGDQSISYSICKAFLDYCKKKDVEPCLIVFDAHADSIQTEKKFPTNCEWLRSIVEAGFPGKNILLVGIRSLKLKEISFLKDKRIIQISMNQLLEDLQGTCDAITEFSNGKELYVSIDIDVIDPAFAPSTEFPESGGLSARDFLYIVGRISRNKNLRGVDITEINEVFDKKNNNSTIRLGAKILGELI